MVPGAVTAFVVWDIVCKIERRCHINYMKLGVVEHAAMLHKHAHISAGTQAAAHLDKASRANVCEPKRICEQLIIIARIAVMRTATGACEQAFHTTG